MFKIFCVTRSFKMATIVLVFGVFATYSCFANGQCVSPDTTCKSLYECSPYLNILKNPDRTKANIDLLLRSKCGFEGNIPKVCCPDLCITPDGKAGKCVGIYSCPNIISLLEPPTTNENLQYVRNSKCSGQDKISVCCSPEPTRNVEQSFTETDCVASVSAFPPDPRTKCCGVEGSFGNRILGGNETAIDNYPWMLLIEYVSKRDGGVSLLCGGALISGRYGLTAAHCVVKEILNKYTPTNVRLGEYDTSNDGKDCATVEAGGEDCTDGIVVIPIEEITAHPDYEKTYGPHDIALIRLQQMAPFTDFIRPICLPTTDMTLDPPSPANFTLFAAGWGVVSVTQPYSTVKLHVDLPYVPKDMCERDTSYKLDAGQICAGGVEGKDSCKGDSGGPLMFENETWEVIGVVSYGPIPCGQANFPAVYTKVYEYSQWIKSVIRA